ncbi:MAG: TetR/AcrR family transcriptional regulator [Myxococcota bacterium]
MARPPKRRNEAFPEKRRALLEKLSAVMLTPEGATLSFRAIARASGVTPPTLRHYFRTHEGVVEAVLAHVADAQRRRIETLASDDADRDATLRSLYAEMIAAWQDGLDAAFSFGTRLPPAQSAIFVDRVVEPWMHAVEARLARLMARGELRRANVRHAAMALLGPLTMGLLLRDTWSAARRPAIDDLAQEQLAAFVAAYGA